MLDILDTPEAIAYHNMKRLLWNICKGFKNRGIDPDDLYGEAALAFVRAYRSYNPERGQLTTHVTYCVRNRLLDMLRRGRSVKRSFTRANVDPDQIAVRQHPTYHCNLSTDGRILLDLLSIAQRRIVVSYLLSIGWAATRIHQSLCEVQEELT